MNTLPMVFWQWCNAITHHHVREPSWSSVFERADTHPPYWSLVQAGGLMGQLWGELRVHVVLLCGWEMWMSSFQTCSRSRSGCLPVYGFPQGERMISCSWWCTAGLSRLMWGSYIPCHVTELLPVKPISCQMPLHLFLVCIVYFSSLFFFFFGLFKLFWDVLLP